TMEGVGKPGESVSSDHTSTYSVEVDALEEGLKRKDRQALTHALDIAERLAQEYGHLGKEINELLLLLISKFSFMQELEEKEQFIDSLNTQIEQLQGKIAGKTS